MEQTTYTTSVLIPTNGYKITQADDATPLQERIFSDKLYLAVNDSPDNYKEITIAQADELQRQQQAEIDAQTKNVEP